MADPNIPPPQAPPPGSSQVPAKQRGCWFYGCLTLAILALLGGIAAWIAVRYAVRTASGWVEGYTSTNRIPIESVSISQGELKSLQDRVVSFSRTLDGQQGSRDLVLSADEINALIQNDPQYKDLRSKLHVMLEGDQIKGKLSMPLDDVGFKDRYLNGLATIKVTLADGVLNINLKDVQVGDKPLPPAMLSELRKYNFAQNVQTDPDAQRSLQKFESIQVKDSKLIIRAKEPPKP